MKKMIFIASVFIFLVTGNACAQIKEPDTLFHKVFLSLKNKDVNIYLEIFPKTYDSFKKLIVEMSKSIENETERAGMVEAMTDMTEEEYETDMLGNLKEDFEEFIADGGKKGIRFASLKLVSTDFDAAQMEEDGVKGKMISGIMKVEADGQVYDIPFSDVLWSGEQNGWFGINLIDLRKEGELPDPIDSVMVEDIIITETKEMEPPPPPPPVKPKLKTDPAAKPKTVPATKPKTQPVQKPPIKG